MRDIYKQSALASDEIEFIICNSCFWCASIHARFYHILKCPNCDTNSLEHILINLDIFSIDNLTKKENKNENISEMFSARFTKIIEVYQPGQS